MVYVVLPRPALHRTRRQQVYTTGANQCTRAVGTKRGDRCHHQFRCWFRNQCRGTHDDLEKAYFDRCNREALDLSVPVLHVPECEHELDEDIFHDAMLIPHTRRRHRRVRKGQRGRLRRKNRAEFRAFRRAQRRVESGPTRNVMVQTEPKLSTKATQAPMKCLSCFGTEMPASQNGASQNGADTTSSNGHTASSSHHTASCNHRTIDSSPREKEEGVTADAIVQTQQDSQDVASQCGIEGSGGEMAESEAVKDLHHALGLADAEYKELQFELEGAITECKNLQWLLKDLEEREQAMAAETSTSHTVPRRMTHAEAELLDMTSLGCSSDEEEKYCDY